jgi:hypothetical protein
VSVSTHPELPPAPQVPMVPASELDMLNEQVLFFSCSHKTNSLKKDVFLSISCSNLLSFIWYCLNDFGSNPLTQATELKLSIDSLEKERDFYFAKLRDIEILLQCPGVEASPVIQHTSTTLDRSIVL